MLQQETKMYKGISGNHSMFERVYDEIHKHVYMSFSFFPFFKWLMVHKSKQATGKNRSKESIQAHFFKPMGVNVSGMLCLSMSPF